MRRHTPRHATPSLLNRLTTILCFLFLGCVLIWSFADRQAYYDRQHHATR